MESQLRDNSNTEDVFEIVDYSSASPWERFIASIETLIQTWGIDSGSFGVLDPDKLNIPKKHSFTTIPTKETDSVYHIKKEIITFGDNSYTLSYHYLPDAYLLSKSNPQHVTSSLPTSPSPFPSSPILSTTLAGSSTPLVFPQLNICPLSFNSTDSDKSEISVSQKSNPLHRWTGFSHILILSPFHVSDIFTSSNNSSKGSSSAIIVDFSASKFLISSFAIAFHNTNCAIPVFVPTGPPWKSLWNGYRYIGREPSLPLLDYRISFDEEPTFNPIVGDIEWRIKMNQINHTPPPYTHLSGLLDLFTEKLFRGHPSECKYSFFSLFSFLFSFLLKNSIN